MLGQSIAIALLFVLASAPVVIACSGTVLFDAAGGEGKNHISIKKGEKLKGFDHLLRDRKTDDVLVCNHKHCYPAVGLDQDQRPQEIIRLEGCEITDASSDEDGLERHEIKDIKTGEAPRGDSLRRRGNPAHPY